MCKWNREKVGGGGGGGGVREGEDDLQRGTKRGRELQERSALQCNPEDR